MHSQSVRFYEFSPFRIDTAKRVLLREGDPVQLTPKAFDTLLVLVQNSGRILEKEEMMRALWPDTIVEEGNLSQNIFILRKALCERPNEHRYIVTVPRRGYCFVANVRGLTGEESGLMLGEFTGSNQIDRGEVVRSIAVLPFKPLSGQESDNYLGLGLTDALITKLSNVRQVAVRPTNAVRKYACAGQDSIVAGRELMVDAVLDGCIQMLSDRIRVTVQLLRVQSGTPLWAEKFDERMTDIFILEDSISEQVAKALALKLTGEEKRRLTKRETKSNEAFQAYLKGRYFRNKMTPEALKKSVEYFQQAIKSDPLYALAYAGLADSYTLLALGEAVAPKEVLPKAKAAAMKALEIDEKLAEVHTSLAYIKETYDWDWSGAEEEFLHAMSLNPNYAMAHHWYAMYLTAMRRQDEAITAIRWAQELDPLSLIVNTNRGLILYFGRQYDQTIEQCRELIEMDPSFVWSHVYLGLAYEQKHEFRHAISAFDKARSLENTPMILAARGHTYAAWGKRSEAEKVLVELKSLSKQQYVSPYSKALMYTGLGENDKAFEWLEKAYKDRSAWLFRLKVDPRVDSLRPDPRFLQLLDRLRLMP